MPKVYRAMTIANGEPRIGRTARSLGVRPNEDIKIQSDGTVLPAAGGMSVAPSWRDLPGHRIPRRFRGRGAHDATGNNADACWTMGEGEFTSGQFAASLVIGIDKFSNGRPIHGNIQPEVQMIFEQYEAALAATRDAWRIDEN
jgi:hypothetical protein